MYGEITPHGSFIPLVPRLQIYPIKALSFGFWAIPIPPRAEGRFLMLCAYPVFCTLYATMTPGAVSHFEEISVSFQEAHMKTKIIFLLRQKGDGSGSEALHCVKVKNPVKAPGTRAHSICLLLFQYKVYWQ